jgi:predicted aldo/keto reductase-like oxidoreductase
MKRRSLFRGAVAGSLAATLAPAAQAASPAAIAPPESDLPPLPTLTDPGERHGDMLYRKLGNTGVRVSAIGFGGSHFAKPKLSQTESIRLCHAAIERGITFMDNSWDYNQGVSEERMGMALAQGGYRQRVFLMTKVDGRTKEAAQMQLETSLNRLQTDHIDLWQFHEVLRFDDPDRIFAPGGAIEAAMEARKAGKVRFIGFTGHKDPAIHLYMLQVARQHGFQFDAVLMPSNVMDGHYRSFARNAMPVALKDGLGVLTMKPFGGGPGVILESQTATPIECLHYALNLPTSTVITGLDNDKVIDQAVEAVRTFQPMSAAQVDAILAKTAAAAADGGYELFKTTSHFDETAKNAEWLGTDSQRTLKLAPKDAG